MYMICIYTFHANYAGAEAYSSPSIILCIYILLLMIIKQIVTSKETNILLMIIVKHITGLDQTQENPIK